MPKYFLLIIPFVWLTGCATPEEIHTMHENKCINYGYQTGTVEMSNCIATENRSREERIRQANHDQYLQNMRMFEQQQRQRESAASVWRDIANDSYQPRRYDCDLDHYGKRATCYGR